MQLNDKVQHVYLVGAKSLGAYGGYETFVYKLTEYHQNPEQVKFIPHQFIVVPSTCDVEDVRMKLHDSGFSTDMVISVSEYRKKLGLIKCFYSDLLLIPGMIVRIKKYIGRNGINGTIKKIRKRLKKG